MAKNKIKNPSLNLIEGSRTGASVSAGGTVTYRMGKLSAGTWLVVQIAASNASNASATYNNTIEVENTIEKTCRHDMLNGGGCVCSLVVTLNSDQYVNAKIYSSVATTFDINTWAIKIA